MALFNGIFSNRGELEQMLRARALQRIGTQPAAVGPDMGAVVGGLAPAPVPPADMGSVVGGMVPPEMGAPGVQPVAPSPAPGEMAPVGGTPDVGAAIGAPGSIAGTMGQQLGTTRPQPNVGGMIGAVGAPPMQQARTAKLSGMFGGQKRPQPAVASALGGMFGGQKRPQPAVASALGGVFGGQKRPQPGAGVEQAMRFSGIRKSLAGKKPGGPI